MIDTRKKEAIALFRVSGSNVGGGTDIRSVHMSFWNVDGSAILVANLHGKLLERIDVSRNGNGKIKHLQFNQSASLGVGKGMAITAGATVFHGNNANGRKLIGAIVGNYDAAALGDLTPNGKCKEDGCNEDVAAVGGRPNNLIICPIPSTNRKAYITMAGGGLLVADTDSTPMQIVGEYSRELINGAGCGGGQTDELMWLNAGVSASGAGANQSTFSEVGWISLRHPPNGTNLQQYLNHKTPTNQQP